MTLLYNFASGLRRVYWYIVRPTTTGVKCLIENNDSYLFVKHSYGSRTHNWNLPGGGLKKNEIPCDAVKREVFEELGIILDEVVLLKSYTTEAEYKIDTVHCYYAKTTSNYVLNTGELLEAKWFPKNLIPENSSRSIKESLSALLY